MLMEIYINLRENYNMINVNNKIMYDGKSYVYINLNKYSKINMYINYPELSDTPCEWCVKNNKGDKFVIFEEKNYNFCIQVDNFEEIRIECHYHGYKWGPGCTYHNALQSEILYIVPKHFDSAEILTDFDKDKILTNFD